ncbi:MAG: DUF475 domain-containing protein [Burkholderiaceae bacterium]
MRVFQFLSVMFREFWGAWLITFVALIAAYFVGGRFNEMAAWSAVLAVLILVAFEVSISFDNAVVNAMVLKHQSPAFRVAFLTIGYLIAVVGVRLILPFVIVAFATGMAFAQVYDMAVYNPDEYSRQLHLHHVEVMLFGGAFLMMVALTWLFDHEREIHWLGGLERRLGQFGRLSMVAVGITLLLLLLIIFALPVEKRYVGLLAGVMGTVIYVFVSGLSDAFGGGNEYTEATQTVKKGFSASLGAFMYLEVLDASFSFDGVIGAFAISKDIFVIMLGLGVGAQWVRSLTVFLVKRDTLSEYRYLEHGAHWAILALASLMFLSSIVEVPEVVTGLIGLVLISLSFWSSLIARRRDLAKH